MNSANANANGDPDHRVTREANRSNAVSRCECLAYAELAVVGIEPSASADPISARLMDIPITGVPVELLSQVGSIAHSDSAQKNETIVPVFNGVVESTNGEILVGSGAVHDGLASVVMKL